MNEYITMVPAENLSFLTGIYRWGIEIIRVIQKMENPVLTGLIKGITALGTENFYIPLIVIIFWWIDEKRGLRLGFLIIISAWINAFMKDLWKQPRPFHLEPSLGLAMESSYGAPSGHAQMSLTFWIPMAAWLCEKPGRKRCAIWTGAVSFILLMGFTRLYLGVHFPTDLLAGWILGGIILVLWFFLRSRGEAILTQAGFRVQNITVAVLVLLMNSLFPLDRSLPALLLGFCIGYTLMKHRFPFGAKGEINGKKPGYRIMAFRCLSGFLGLAILFIALRLILPGEGSLFGSIPIWGAASPFYELGRFIRYSLIGFWVSAGAPRMFQHMGLAEIPHNPDTKENSSGAELQ